MQITCSFKLSLGGILHKMQFEEWHDITIHLFKYKWYVSVCICKKLLNNPIQPLDLLIHKCLIHIPNLEKYKNLLIKHLSSDTPNTTKPGCSGPHGSLWAVSLSVNRGSLQGMALPGGTAAQAEALGSSGPHLPLPSWAPHCGGRHLRGKRWRARGTVPGCCRWCCVDHGSSGRQCSFMSARAEQSRSRGEKVDS